MTIPAVGKRTGTNSGHMIDASEGAATMAVALLGVPGIQKPA